MASGVIKIPHSAHFSQFSLFSAGLLCLSTVKPPAALIFQGQFIESRQEATEKARNNQQDNHELFEHGGKDKC